MQLTRLSFILFTLVTLLAFWLNSALGAEIGKEFQLKAAYLYNFARFISWPENFFDDSNGTLNICVVGENPFGSILSELESKEIDKHAISVHYFEDFSSPPIQKCHLAFLHGPATDRELQALKEALVKSVSVSDAKGFAHSGGDIEFILVQDKLRFIINNTALKEKGLKPRASLLELAADVY